MKKENQTTPIYQRIAVDVASKIIEGHYNVGEKIYARSTLATHYNVSSETARRATSILVDMNVCDSRHGSGVVVKSREKAIELVKHFQNIATVDQVKRDIVEIVEKQNHDLKTLKKLIDDLMDKVNRFKSVNPFIPYEIIIDKSSIHLNKSLSDIKFWNHTWATVVGIRRNQKLIMSPGPKEKLSEGDILYFVGSEACQDQVRNYLYPNKG